MACDTSSTLKHKHHIIPRYMGGSNDPENLIELTVVQHSMWHFCNYKLWGNWEDYLAYKAIAGHINKEEINRFKLEKALEKGRQVISEKRKSKEFRDKMKKELKSRYKNPGYREKMAEHCRKIQHLAVNASKSPEAREKRKETLRNINHQVGEKNSNYGNRWIHSLEFRVSKRIRKTDALPEGWAEGRVIRFHPCIDKKFNWSHPVYGRVEGLTVLELVKKFPELKLNQNSLYMLVDEKAKSHLKWKIEI